MSDFTNQLTALYHPTSALVFYQTKGSVTDTYVEYFDMDSSGSPVNAHPLTVKEAGRLAKALKLSEKKENCLKPNGILGNHILYLDALQGKAIWFTKATKRQLFFSERLAIPRGKASVPAMLWAANRTHLYVFALATNRRPTEKTKLYNAPFFNIYENGNVCMGTVDVRIKRTASLEEFTSAWEDYFFNSYFSHLMGNYNPIRGNCVSLWEHLITAGESFPKEILKKSSITFKNLLP